MYQTLGPFWRAVLHISWGRFLYVLWAVLVWAVLAIGRLRPFAFVTLIIVREAKNCDILGQYWRDIEKTINNGTILMPMI